MRPLNRPMFRYGGPIKEGIMSGIKEPRQNYNRAGKVLKYIPGGQNLVNKISTGTKDIIPRTIQKIKNFYSGDPSRYGVPAAEGLKQKTIRFLKPDEKAGVLTNKYLFDRTLVPAAGAVKYGVQKALPYATAGGLTIGGGTALYNSLKGDPKIDDDGISQENKIKAAIGMPENLTIRKNPETAQIIADKLNQDATKSAEELRKDRVQKYRDIMDIKGMNKDAAYNSLIAASQLINQEGDFKGSIKDGSLISKIIGATGKAFDKPSQTKDAINTLIAKAEIEKDINKEKNALENKKTNLQIKAAEKALAGDSFDEAILKSITGTSGKMPTGSKLAGILKATKGIDSVVLDGSQVTPGGEVKFLQESVNEKIKEGTSVNPGAYVLNTKILIVDEQGNVSQYY
jgi:hypothetical protein